MNPLMFREYDIRGVADRDLTDEVVRALGQGIGTLILNSGGRCLALGRDCRLHSPRLHASLLAGLLASGVDVIDLGVVPSPVLYYAVHSLAVDGGVQITGSHNPASDNGFKILCGRRSLDRSQLEALRDMVASRAFRFGQGAVADQSVVADYLVFVQSRLQLGTRRFPVVIDAGNGTGGVVALPLLERLGFPTLAVACEMDGRFPLHLPDPTVPENLRELQDAVRRSGAEVGIALDGDADRLTVVDNQGRILWGDQLMILFARAILAEQPGATFVCEVKCSRAVLDEIHRAGGQAVMWRVGHSLIKEKMRQTGAALGGEMSGHLFFAHRYLGFDDAIYAAARLLELLSRSAEPLEKLVDGLPHLFNTPELRIAVPDEQKFAVVRKMAESLRRTPAAEVIELDGVRVTWPDAWALVRASNTQPAIGLRFEAESELRLRSVQSDVQALLKRTLSEPGLTTMTATASEAPTGDTAVDRLTFYYDIGNPYCYLAVMQLPLLLARCQSTVRFVPVVSGRVQAAAECTASLGPARLRYLQTDMARWARRLRVPLHFPSRFPMNTIRALRLCVQVAQRGESEHRRLVKRLLEAYWVEDIDLLDGDALRLLLVGLQLPADELLHGCSLPDVAAMLQNNTEQAIAAGVFQTPTFQVGNELFVGHDCCEFVAEALLEESRAKHPSL
mgnify:CR=1 FL=1